MNHRHNEGAQRRAKLYEHANAREEKGREWNYARKLEIAHKMNATKLISFLDCDFLIDLMVRRCWGIIKIRLSMIIFILRCVD